MSSNERIMILKMLEEGKIGADEAAKLLAAVSDENKAQTSEKAVKTGKSIDSSETVSNNNSNSNSKSASSSSLDFDELGRTVGNISRDLAKKIGIFAKDMAPKVQNLTETLVEKTVEVTDKISKSASDFTTPKPAEKTVSTKSVKTEKTVKSTPIKRNAVLKEKNCEMSVPALGVKEFYMVCVNGGVYIKGYNGDKITAKITYKSVSDDIQISQAGGRYYLDYDENDFESISVEAYIPEKLFERVQIISSNGEIRVDAISPQELSVENTNGNINLKRLNCVRIKAESGNGELILENIVADELKAITTNAKILADNLDIQKIELESGNAQINFRIAAISKFREYNWNISTSNAGIRANVPIGEIFGYNIEATTSLNRVMAGITGLQYKCNENNYISAKSSNFETSLRKVNIVFETSNAPININ